MKEMSIANMGRLLLILSSIIVLANRAQATDVDLVEECGEHLRNIDTIEKMEVLIEKLTSYHNAPSEHVTEAEKHKMELCLDQYDKITGLSRIFPTPDTDVCNPEFVSQVLQYHYKHGRSPKVSFLKKSSSKPMIRRFLRRYLLHINYVCRMNLVTNLEEAMRESDIGEADFMHVIPFRGVEQQSVPNDTAMQDIGGQDESIDGAKKALFKVLESIKDVDCLADMIPIGWDKPSSIDAQETVASERQRNVLQETNSIMFHDGRMNTTLLACDKLAKYYEGSILSIVRTSNAGFKWFEKKIAKEMTLTEQQSQLKNKWLKATMVCFVIRTIYQPSSLDDEQRGEHHSFSSNRISSTETLGTSDKFMKKNALSKAQHSRRTFLRNINKFAVKTLVKNINKLKTLMPSQASKIEQLVGHLEQLSDDQPSLMSAEHKQLTGLLIALFGALLILFAIIKVWG